MGERKIMSGAAARTGVFKEVQHMKQKKRQCLRYQKNLGKYEYNAKYRSMMIRVIRDKQNRYPGFQKIEVMPLEVIQ